MSEIPRPEYPRPQFERAEWLNLNGVWRFEFDDNNVGLAEKWFQNPAFTQQISVPFAFQSPLSGIGTNDFHDVVWYARSFEVPRDWHDKTILLHFGAVDYRAWVWVNGIFVTYHQGGHTPFSADITAYLQQGDNQLVVRVEDLSEDVGQPRGKQYWKRKSDSIFYTRTTGIWQTVWLEPVAGCYLGNIKITPVIDARQVQIDYHLAGNRSETVRIETRIQFGDEPPITHIHETEVGSSDSIEHMALPEPVHLWSPEQPSLYDLTIRLIRDDQVIDEVQSYFGMRKVDIHEGRIRLNNQPYYMRLVLDQGYHPEGILTFPADGDFKNDIDLIKRMGFNGVRKHQKVEDPRFLYWADKRGLLVWGEMANAYQFSPDYIQRITSEWTQVIQRDYNHPCIVAWVPINESWGVPDLQADAQQRAHLEAMYYLTRSLDTTRLVVSNDGWEHAKTDILTIHDYESSGEVLWERYHDIDSTLAATPANRDLFVKGYQHDDEPVLLTEFGGVAFRKSNQEGWGYSTAHDADEFLRRYAEIMNAVLASPVLQGYCYTQLTDVEQEINGLLTYDRQPKVDVQKIASINTGSGVHIT